MHQLVRHLSIAAVVGASALAVGLEGCATRSYVKQLIEGAGRSNAARLATVQAQAEASQQAVASLKSTDAVQDEQISQLAETAREALQRAVAAGKLARGRLLAEVDFSDGAIHFPLGGAGLSARAKQAIDRFAAGLKGGSEGVYIEVQGHTDNRGPADLNLRLGERRASEVMHYLHLEKDIPLHRMNVISYGELKPVADNRTPEGRARNRRVTLVVLS